MTLDFKENGRILALEISGFVLFPNLTGIISLEAAAAFVSYENTHINITTVLLEKTILTLNHYRRVGKGSIRCCE
jgi:hypothetical protein